MADPVLSVVVPTYGRRAQVLETIEPLLADPAVLEVVVVVDGSADGTAEALADRARSAPRLRPVWQENAGEGAARQRGAELARGDLVLFLDDDVVPAAGTGSGHVAAHAGEPGWDSGRVVIGAMPTPAPAERGPDSVTTDLYRAAYAFCVGEYTRDPAHVLDNLWMGHVSMPRALALEVGMADPELAALYFQDRDLGLRLKAHGARAVYRPELVVEHRHRRSLRAFRADALRQGKALTVLHRRYPDLVPEPTPRWIAGKAPGPARWLVAAAAAGPRHGEVLSSGVLGVAWLLGRVRAWRAQRLVVVLLQRVGQAAGVAAAGGPPGARPAAVARLAGLAGAPAVPSPAAELLLPASGGRIVPGRASGGIPYTAVRGWTGATALVPVGAHDLAGAVRDPGPLGLRRRLRRSAANTLAPRTPALTVIGTGPPAVAAAALGPDTPPVALLAGGGGPRRRAVLRASDAIVKVGRGPDAEARAVAEQQVLARLHALGLGAAVPRPLGHGAVGHLVWSAESAADGVPLAELLADTSRPGRERVRRVLEPVAAWLGELAAATREPSAVLVHGDLAAGLNLLVDRHGRATLLDWETAAEGGALDDLLPLLAAALAAGRDDQAGYVLRLCAGTEPESVWLLAAVRRHLRRTGIPTSEAGAPAARAWRRQAGMQEAHRELVAEAGGHVEAWSSPWPAIAAGWAEHPGLGTAWTALEGG